MGPIIDIEATGRNIDRIRKAKGLSVKDIQEYMGLAGVQAIYHWISGKTLPTMENMYMLSELFGMSIDDILCGTKLPVKPNNILIEVQGDSCCCRLKRYYSSIGKALKSI